MLPFDGVFARARAYPAHPAIPASRFQQKSQPSEIDAQNRNISVHIHIQRAQHRAVAAKHEEHIDHLRIRFRQIARIFSLFTQFFDQFLAVIFKEYRLDAPCAAKFGANPNRIINRRLILIQIKHRVANHAAISPFSQEFKRCPAIHAPGAQPRRLPVRSRCASRALWAEYAPETRYSLPAP